MKKKQIVVGILLIALLFNLFSIGAIAEETQDPAGTSGLTENTAPADVGEAANDTSAPYTTTALSADFEKVAGNNDLELYVNEKIGSIGVKDLHTGYIWYSSVSNDTYSKAGLTQLQLDQLNSLFVLTYTVLNDNNNKTFTYPVNSLSPKITSSKIPNGARITYAMEEINLQVAADVVLEDGALSVTIPKDQLIEGEGTESKMKEQIDAIQEFIDECNTAIDEVESYGISGNKKEIRLSRGKLGELQELVDNLTSLVGVAAVQSKASIILQDELMNYLCGGAGYTGIFPRTASSGKVGDKSSYFSNMNKTFESKVKKCASKFSLLTSIKIAGVVNVAVLPNFGAAGDLEEGYVFYPDGSGALTYNTPNHAQSTESYETNIYSDTTVNMAWEWNRDTTGLKRTMLPVYGSKKGNQAFLAIIEEGDTNAAICFYPSGNTVNLNRINSKFTYRNTIQINSSSEYSTNIATIFEKTSLDISPKVRYQFLSGGKYSPDYSGMANAYRDYLLKTEQIKKSPLLNGKMPLALDFITGTWKSMLFYNSYVSISSFEELTSVVEELGAEGIDNILLYLQNWDKNYSPSSLKVPKAAGGAAGLKSLTEAVQNAGGNIYLDVDLVSADTFSRRINQSSLALRSDSRIYEFKTFWYKLFSPAYVRETIPTATKQLETLGNPGVALYEMGTLIYSDYNTRYNTRRDDTAKIWTDIYKMLGEKSSTAAFGGNKYLLEAVDWLMDIPMSSTGYTFSDEAVPFYQMVVHGSIPYSAKPFNHFYDVQKEKLQNIEYGCIPLYKLTYNDSRTLRKLFRSFTTPYANIKEEIIKTYHEFDGKLASLSTEYMVNHDRLTDDVVRVVYSDGTVIYINYSSADYTTGDGIIVPSMDYRID